MERDSLDHGPGSRPDNGRPDDGRPGNSLDRGTLRTAALLRTQLAQLTAASHALESAVGDPRGREQMGVLNQGICRMLRIVGRMELTCRLEGEDFQLQPEPLDLAQVYRELGEEMASLLARAGVELEVRCPRRLRMTGDPALLRQLLLELTSNGARAGRRVTVTLSERGKFAALAVEDDGPGVPPERLEAMFSGGGPGIPEWQQTGNGVAVSKYIAELHGGRLIVGATPGRGLKVMVDLPLNLQVEDVLLESPSPPWDRGGFSDALVGLSDLLPVEVFAPGEGNEL